MGKVDTQPIWPASTLHVEDWLISERRCFPLVRTLLRYSVVSR